MPPGVVVDDLNGVGAAVEREGLYGVFDLDHGLVAEGVAARFGVGVVVVVVTAMGSTAVVHGGRMDRRRMSVGVPAGVCWLVDRDGGIEMERSQESKMGSRILGTRNALPPLRIFSFISATAALGTAPPPGFLAPQRSNS